MSSKKIEPIRIRVWPPSGEPERGAAQVDPGDSGSRDLSFRNLPQQLLAEHRQLRQASEVTRILKLARKIRDSVDQVVFIGGRDALAPAIAVLTACREPYFNEWSRAERGGRPRVYLCGDGLDNDHLSMLGRLVAAGRPGGGSPWAMVRLGSKPMSPATRAAWELLSSHGPQIRCPASPSENEVGSVAEHRPAEVRETPWPGAVSPFCSGALLAGSIMGIDIVRLLEGAEFLQRRVETEPGAMQGGMEMVAARIVAALRDSRPQRLVVWSRALAGVGEWLRELSLASLGLPSSTPIWLIDHFPHERSGETSPTPTLSLSVEHWRCDSAPHRLGGTLPAAAAAQVDAWLEERRAAGDGVIDVRMPDHEEASLGQWFQWLLLAHDVARRSLSR